MEKKYSTLVIIFVSIAIISLLGFFKSYLSSLPDFGKHASVIHIHFSVFLAWLLLTIIQPVLIKRKKTDLHRKLGRLSYVLAPVMVITMAILVIEQTKRMIPISLEDASIISFIGLLDVIGFTVYYSIAMLNRKNMRWHVAFILSATLIVLNPGMSRLLNQLQPGLGLLAAVIIPFIVPLIIFLYEKIKLNRPILKNPYALFFCFWAIEILLFTTIPATDFWRNLILGLA